MFRCSYEKEEPLLTTILTFIAVFGTLVVIHELGHYYFAKKAGILVREFSVGFGPKIFAHRKGETTYTIRLLPLGGYVRMAGYEEETDIRPGMPVTVKLDDAGHVSVINLYSKKQLADAVPLEVTSFDLERELFIEGRQRSEIDQTVRYPVNRDALVIEQDGTTVQIAPIDRQFQSAPLIQRMLTNFAGPLNNLLLAIVTFILIAFLQGGIISNEPRAGKVEPGSPAEAAGLEEGDLIRTIDGEKMDSWVEMVLTIQEHPEEELTLEVQKPEGATETLTVVPEADTTEDGQTYGLIGVNASMENSIIAKISYGFTQTWNIITQIGSVLLSMVTGGFSVDMFGGPVAIYATTEAVVQTGAAGILNWLAVLSINLGILNLLPVPALDGGKLLLNVIEGIRGKPLSEEKEGIIMLIGVGLLFLLMVVVTWNDIQRFFLR